jgi:hypothetical protein
MYAATYPDLEVLDHVRSREGLTRKAVMGNPKMSQNMPVVGGAPRTEDIPVKSRMPPV